MKVLKKFMVTALSLFVMAMPCFAQCKWITINNEDSVVDTKMFNGKNYLQLKTLAEAAGYTVNFNNSTKNATIAKGNQTLTLSKGELKIVNGHIYVPLAKVITYFGDSIQVYGQAYEQFDMWNMMGEYEGNIASMFMGIYSGDGTGYIDLNINGRELRASLIDIGDNRYSVMNTPYRLDFYPEEDVYAADLYYNDEFIDSMICINYPGYWASISN